MKTNKMLIFSVLLLVFLSCSKITPNTQDSFQSLSSEVQNDFVSRYPGVTVTEASEGIVYGENQDVVAKIVFTDKEGLVNTAIYNGGVWAVTEKQFDVNDFITKIPRKVLKAYTATGIENEEYTPYIDWSHVLEVSRNGLDNKQYEFLCTAPFWDGDKMYDRMTYHIVIADDGTMLSYSHTDNYNRSVICYDMNSSIDIIRNKYKGASLLGAINRAGSNVFFVREKGNDIVKTAIVRDSGYGFEWQETYYTLDINTSLPEEVVAERDNYQKQHPDTPYFALSYLENKSGAFYGLSFGSIINHATIYISAK